ncbi:MAG: hypothetical protein K8L91_19370 [Anaerolineae bacterium]|nr:hypothetical protein [Anaerolineae bacterium]
MRGWRLWTALGLIVTFFMAACGKESNEAKIESVGNASPTPSLTEMTETPAPPSATNDNTALADFESIRLPDGIQLEGTLLMLRDPAIYHIPLDGTPPELLNGDIQWNDLSIAPDHQHIAYTFSTPGVDAGPTPPPDSMIYLPVPTSLAILDLTSGESRLIYASDGGIGIVGWSPDGTWLAFSEAIYPPYDPALVATSEYGGDFTYYRANPETNLFAAALQPDLPLARLDGGSSGLWLMDNTLLAVLETQVEGGLTQDLYQFLPDENQALMLETDQAWQIMNVFYSLEMRPTAQRILDEFGLTLAPVTAYSRYYNRTLSPDGSLYVEAMNNSSPVPVGTEPSACSLHHIVIRGIERAVLPEPIVTLDDPDIIGVRLYAWLPVENDPEAVELIYVVRQSATCTWEDFTTTLVHRLPDGTLEELAAPPTGWIADVLVPPQSRVILWIWQDQDNGQSSLNLYDLATGENHVLAESEGELFSALWWIG